MSELALPRRSYPVLSAGEAAQFPVLHQFRQFCRELLRIKHALEAGSGNLSAEGEHDRQDPLTLIHHHLRALIERLLGNAGGIYGGQTAGEVQYMMAAIADELLLFTGAADMRELWNGKLIESAVFGTRIAGERVFDCIDALLDRGHAANPELAAIYLTALSLGFRGKYRAIQDEAALQQYRRQLRTVLERNGILRLDAGQTLFSNAYAHTLDDGSAVRLPYLRPWIIAIAAALALYLAVQEVIWVRGTSAVEDVLSSFTVQPGGR